MEIPKIIGKEVAGGTMLGCHLRASGVTVCDSAGTCSNLSYFLIKLDMMLNPRYFVPGHKVNTGNCILVILET